MNVKIDEEIQSLLPPLTKEEYETLEAKLKAEGCRDSLILWKETGILLEGHNRLTICKKHGIKPYFQEMSFACREDAVQWVIDHQMGRRNITDHWRAYFIGKEYLNKKKSHGGDRKSESSGQSGHLKTEEAVAEKHGVSPKTVRRDAEYAEAVDQIAEEDGKEAKVAILSGATQQTKKEVVEKSNGKPEPSRKEIVKKAKKDGIKALGVLVRIFDTLGWSTKFRPMLDEMNQWFRGEAQ